MFHRCRFVLLVLVLAALAASPRSASAWGPAGHTTITEHALQILPKEIKPFYEANSRYIVAFCMLPDDWRLTDSSSGPNHYIDLDLLEAAPFANVRTDRKTLEERFGKEKADKAGRLPWAIEERYNKLVSAFKRKDSVDIALQSAILAHFVGDAHVPFHATKDYDGRKPEEKGLHFRWEENLVELTLKSASINAPAPNKMNGSILDAAFTWCADSYSSVDAICAVDDKARAGDPGFGFKYFRTMSQETGDILIERLTSGSENLAGVYIAAWQAAGSPALPDKPGAFFIGQ